MPRWQGPCLLLGMKLTDYRGANLFDELQTQLNGAGQAVFETYVLLPGEVNRHFPRNGRTDALSDWHREQQQQQQQQ